MLYPLLWNNDVVTKILWADSVGLKTISVLELNKVDFSTLIIARLESLISLTSFRQLEILIFYGRYWTSYNSL